VSADFEADLIDLLRQRETVHAELRAINARIDRIRSALHQRHRRAKQREVKVKTKALTKIDRLREIDLMRPYLMKCASRWFRGIDCDDLVQETVIYAWQELKGYDSHRGSLRSWLFALMRSWYWAEIDLLRTRGVIMLNTRKIDYE